MIKSLFEAFAQAFLNALISGNFTVESLTNKNDDWIDVNATFDGMPFRFAAHPGNYLKKKESAHFNSIIIFDNEQLREYIDKNITKEQLESVCESIYKQFKIVLAHNINEQMENLKQMYAEIQCEQ